jgi:glycosyltransferase involved in cell wall biosynthesis
MNSPVTKIQPLGKQTQRPQWSVMIPAYNCAKFLEQTLKSVLTQDPGAEHMQIEVVDDQSSDHAKEVVERIGKGRVNFHRNEQNQGPIKNFNVCLQRSRGQWVHILHGDDYVQEGFYQAVEKMFITNPDIALAATRCFFVNENSEPRHLSPYVPRLSKPTREASRIFYINPLQASSVVIRRSFYEQHGGFREDLVHTADWEMWIRAFALGGGMVHALPLGAYRCFEENHTAQLRKTGENLRDYLRLGGILEKQYPDFNRAKFHVRIRETAGKEMKESLRRNDRAAWCEYLKIWKEVTSFRDIAKSFRDHLLESAEDFFKKIK